MDLAQANLQSHQSITIGLEEKKKLARAWKLLKEHLLPSWTGPLKFEHKDVTEWASGDVKTPKARASNMVPFPISG